MVCAAILRVANVWRRHHMLPGAFQRSHRFLTVCRWNENSIETKWLCPSPHILCVRRINSELQNEEEKSRPESGNHPRINFIPFLFFFAIEAYLSHTIAWTGAIVRTLSSSHSQHFGRPILAASSSRHHLTHWLDCMRTYYMNPYCLCQGTFLCVLWIFGSSPARHIHWPRTRNVQQAENATEKKTEKIGKSRKNENRIQCVEWHSSVSTESYSTRNEKMEKKRIMKCHSNLSKIKIT